MTEGKIDIRSGSLLPWHFQLMAALVLIAGVALTPENPLPGVLLVVTTGFILTGASGTEIDLSKDKFREYTLFYFKLKIGKWQKFNGAEKVFINSSKKSATVHTAHTSHSSVFTNQEFNGYLKLKDGTKIHLQTSRKKEKLAATLNSAASFLQVPLQDNTVNH